MSAVSVRLDGGHVAAVRNIYCIGRNYAEHASELNNPVPGEPVVFMKATTALRPLSAGELAFPRETFHHEAELVLLLGREVPLGATVGWDAVAALGLGLDLTRREVQSGLKAKGLPWLIAKSFAGAAPVSEFLPCALFPDLERIRFTLSVGGELRQTGDTQAMLFKVPVLLTYLASLGALAAGDLVFTGTPKGVGPIRLGDDFRLEFPDLGRGFAGKL